MLIIEYIHFNLYIHGDIKPDNILIDNDNNVVLIDFESMILEKSENERTINCSIYSDPKCQTYFGDIYSLGKNIEFIINNKRKNEENVCSDYLYIENYLKLTYLKCISDKVNGRPTIFALIRQFFYKYQNYVTINNIDKLLKLNMELAKKNIGEKETSQYLLINLNFINIYYESDINKKINAKRYFLSIQNIFEEAYFVLNKIYFECKNQLNQINQSIFGFSISFSGNSNDLNKNCNNGYDIQKIIQNLHINANNNDPLAQYYLGVFNLQIFKNIMPNQNYLNCLSITNPNKLEVNKEIDFLIEVSKYFKLNIEEGIYWLELSAKQNFICSLFILGYLYIFGENKYYDSDSSMKYTGIIMNQDILDLKMNFTRLKNISKYVGCKVDIGIKYLTIVADQNNVIAQYLLGILYLDSKIVIKDIKKAMHYLNLAVNQNNSLAQYQMGFLYYNGLYIDRNEHKGIDLLKLSAKQNNPLAQYSLFLILIRENSNEINVLEALKYLNKAADQNLPDSQCLLGYLYLMRLIPFEDKKNNLFFDTIVSVNKSYTDLINSLSKCFDVSKYIKPDFKKALKNLEKAANQDHIPVLIGLGSIYENGLYVVKDYEKSIFYYKKLADQNISYGQFLLGQLYIQIGSVSEGVLYLKLSANQNYSLAQFMLGILYLEGEKLDYNIDNAIKYLILAAENNNSNDQYLLGSIYFYSFYEKQDIKKAIKYFKLAAYNGLSDAQYTMGVIYLEGKYEEKRIEDGLNLIDKSSKNRSTSGMFVNGCLYHKGEFVIPDIDKSISLYKESMNNGDLHAKNNLAMIYKLGYKNKIPINVQNAIVYLKESCKNDEVSMYNLAHIYIYNDIFNNIDQSIHLLIQSSQNDFIESEILLCIVLIKKYGFNIKLIIEYLINIYKLTQDHINNITMIIQTLNLLNQSEFIKQYENYRNIDYLYDYNMIPISSKEFYNKRSNTKKLNSKCKDITEDFLKGFGIDFVETND